MSSSGGRKSKQKTVKGLEVPVPERKDVFRRLKRAAKGSSSGAGGSGK